MQSCVLPHPIHLDWIESMSPQFLSRSLIILAWVMTNAAMVDPSQQLRKRGQAAESLSGVLR